jgi:hypothetical protein
MRALLAVLVAGFVVAGAADAGVRRPRPTDVPDAQTSMVPNAIQAYNDYATPERTFVAQRAVVHYVVLGIDAPPLNDDDGDAVPDYVERVGAAADVAIDYYLRRGFRPIRPDSGGPDERPDIYVSRFSPGSFGIALPAVRAEGGAFVVVSNALDPSGGRSLASVYGTVAHELFHLVQFSYFPAAVEPELPPWVLEGTAAGLEARVFPELDDIVSSLQLRAWLGAPNRSIAGQSYGAQLFWRQIDVQHPKVLPAVLERLASHSRSGGAGAVVAETFRRVTGRPFAPAFHHFAVAAAADYPVTPLKSLAPSRRYRSSVPPLAIHYVRLSRRPGTVTVTFSLGQAKAAATLAYEWESEVPGFPSAARRIGGRVSRGGRTLTFSVPASLARSPRFASPLLIVSNGDAASRADYAAAAR